MPLRASDHVWALVSGLPSSVRGSRLLMILQACIDESASKTTRPGGFFLMAGLIASSEQWAVFSDEWRAALNETPSLEYFKLSEALSMKDQFDPSRGWTEADRDQRVAKLAQIARAHALAGYSVVVPRDDYNDFVRAFARPKEFSDPYFFCFYQIIDAISESRQWLGGSQSLKYIVDQQGVVSQRAIDFWRRLDRNLPWRRPADLGDMPIPENDKTFLPLQAADLWAGLVRAREDEDVYPGTMGVRGPWMDVFNGMKVNPRKYSRDRLLELGATLVIRKITERGG